MELTSSRCGIADADGMKARWEDGFGTMAAKRQLQPPSQLPTCRMVSL